MTNFNFNLKGLLNEVKLPEYKALWPLFETVVNSIQSIEESANRNNGEIIILANRLDENQININGVEETAPFHVFKVVDNGEGFNTKNYNSFLEAYSNLKLSKGCKGIGRFLWLKAFKNVEIDSNYLEDGKWEKRKFDFSADAGVEPEENIVPSIKHEYETVVTLSGFFNRYMAKAPLSLEALAKKIIEHCLPYFLSDNCPHIVLRDNNGEVYDLNEYYNHTIKDYLHRDELTIKGHTFTLYHIKMMEGVSKHELHFCAAKREVKSYDLSNYIPDLQKRIVTDENAPFYYLGYLTGDYLDENVNMNRTAFDFMEGESFFCNLSEKELIDITKQFISAYLDEDLRKIREEKRNQIDSYIQNEKPQYRFVLNNNPQLYDEIPANLNKDRLDMELYSATQKWEHSLHETRKEIEYSIKNNKIDETSFTKKFNEYCGSIKDISMSSLAEYVARRKTILDLLEKAIVIQEDNKFCSEEILHSIICPMRHTSDEVSFEEMNLWIIDDRLSYHTFLASDKLMSSLPVIDVDEKKRMDIAIFNQAFSFSDNHETMNSISIIEFKKPNRNDLKSDENNPINQVLGYVKKIKEGQVKKANGRVFSNVKNAAFYCYIIADLTDSMKDAAENASLVLTPDGEGYFGYNQTRGAYIEVISYDKLVKDAKQRNSILFEKLFSPKSSDLLYLK